MKKLWYFIILLILVSSLGIGCARTIVQTNVEEIALSNLNLTIQNWINEIDQTEGIFVSRISQTDKNEDYYIYIKNIRLTRYELKNDSYEGLILSTETNEKAGRKSLVIKITTINKKAEYIILNGKKMDISVIPIIKD